jgi:2'-5' RNA ligase
LNEASIRSFVAIELPDEVARGLALTITCLRKRLPGSDIRWVTPGNIHITLKFLGEVRVSQIDRVRDTLEAVCAGAAPLHLGIDKLGAFPSTRAPRIVWAGLQGDIEQLACLAGQVDLALEPLAFPRENRPFTPHLTVGRVRDHAADSTRNALTAALSSTPVNAGLMFEASAVSLMKSRLTPAGAMYSRTAHLPLGACSSQP